MSGRGRAAEDAALEFLRDRGLTVLERNYRCRFGEIDLVMRQGHTLVFVEVRSRKSKYFGGALESITARKRDRLRAAARHYMAAHKEIPACRFDAVLLESDNAPHWIQNAFGD
ncbi:MAG: YraN family protein [Burkholderiales bacterium]